MLGIVEFDFFKLLIALVTIVPIVYWYLTRNHNYWSKQGISGPKPIIFFGNIIERVKHSPAVIDVQYLNNYGNVYGVFEGTSPVLQVADPELIKQILVKDFSRFDNRRSLRTEHPIVNKNLFFSRSEDWKRMRTITSSTFTSGKMKKLYGLVRECLQDYLDYLDKLAQSGQPFDVKNCHENFTMDVIASCAFATKSNSCKDPNSPFVKNTRSFFDVKAYRFIPAFMFPKYLNRLLNITSPFDPTANEWIVKLTKLIIEKRRESGQRNNDFVQLLLDAKADDNKKEEFTEGLESQYLNADEITDENKSYVNKKLSEDEIVAQCWVFLLAGFETTATTLGYLSYSLALNTECQKKLYNEVMAAMGSQKEISYEDVHRLPYLDACISETLRVYPPVVRLEREVNQDFKLGDKEISLYKGQLVEIPVYAVHHSEKFFANADKFIPERFLPENRNQIIPYTYMPFGTGPRNCIGMRFALMEMKLAMVHIMMRYRFITCDKTEIKLEFKPQLPTLTPKSLTICIEKR